MSLVYIPVGSVETADRLSRGVYRLSRPAGHRPQGYTATHYFGWVVHPRTGAVMLALEPTQTVPCHVAADPSGLLELIADLTTEEQRAQLAGYVAANAGRTVPLAHLIPPAAMEQAMTHDELKAAGWFPDPT